MLNARDIENKIHFERFLLCMVGGAIYAVGVNLFIVPFNLYSGGIVGISQLIRTLLADYIHLQFGSKDVAGIIFYVLNIPILIYAFPRLDKLFFLKTLVAEYLHLLGAPKVKDKGVFDINEPPMTSELSNDFERLCPKTRKSGGFAGPAALQMGGKLSKHTPCKVVQLVYDTDSVMELCHRMGISVTTLTLSLMFLANRSATELNKGLLQFQVPVNMRKFFPESNTMRNFSMYCSIDLPPSKVNSIEEVAPMVAQQLKQKTTYDEMSVMMTTARRLVTSVKLVPLIVKAPIARIIYGFLGDSRFSNTLSNLGKIEMPDELVPYIEGFDFILGTCVVSRASCSMCSFGGNTVLSISKNTKDPSFEERLAALSQELGIKPEIVETSLYG